MDLLLLLWSLIIVLCFLSLWGFAGTPKWAYQPSSTSSSTLSQDVQYDGYDNVTSPCSVCCRFTLSTLSQLRVIVTVDISKWLLMAEKSLLFTYFERTFYYDCSLPYCDYILFLSD